MVIYFWRGLYRMVFGTVVFVITDEFFFLRVYRNDRQVLVKKGRNCSEPPAYCRTISAFPAKAAVKAS